MGIVDSVGLTGHQLKQQTTCNRYATTANRTYENPEVHPRTCQVATSADSKAASEMQTSHLEKASGYISEETNGEETTKADSIYVETLLMADMYDPPVVFIGECAGWPERGGHERGDCYTTHNIERIKYNYIGECK